MLVGNRYALEDKLGEGGIGVVYRAVDRLNGEKVALKQIRAKTIFDAAEDSSFHVALAHEFQVLSSLRHPHIIHVRDYGFDHQQSPFFTMDLLEHAQPLTQAATQLDFAGKIDVLAQLIHALAYLHRRGVSHRDLKPANVMVVDKNQVRVLDFGLAALQKQTHEQRDGVSGTLTYIAPEGFLGQPMGEAADYYAMGLMAYEMFAGQHPFNINNMTELITSTLYDMPDDNLIDAPEPIRRMIMGLLAKQPIERLHTPQETIAFLNQVVEQPLVVETASLRESFLQAAKFVGREAEIHSLQEALANTLNGKGSLWLVGGESGAGKSRLTDEIATQAMVKGALVLRGQGVREGGLPYQLWQDSLRRLALVVPLNDSQVGIVKELIPDIEQLLDRQVPEVSRLDPQPAQQRLFTTIGEMFRAAEQPILLLFDDLQWVTESLDLLKYIAPLASEISLLIIGNYRDDESQDLPDQLPNAQTIKLESLSENGIEELSQAMLGEAGTDPAVVDLLQRETEGNIFFLIEVVRALAEEAGGTHQIAYMTLPDRVFTGGIQQVINRRLEQLSPSARALLEIAAVAGRELDLTLLKIAGQTPNLESWLLECSDLLILEVRNEKWRFVHDKMRDGTLMHIDPVFVPGVHRLVAETIEKLYGDAPELAATLAYHWHQAGDTAKEANYTLKAGQVSLNLCAFREAIRFLERGLELESDEAARADIKMMIGSAYIGLAVYAEARRHYETSVEISRKLGNQNALGEGLGQLGYIVGYGMGKHEEGKVYLAEALQIATDIQDTALMSATYRSLGSISFILGNYAEAKQYCVDGFKLYQTVGDVTGMARMSNNIAVMDEFAGNYDSAFHYFDESLRLARASNLRQNMALGLRGVGNILNRLGRYDEAETRLLEGLQILRQIHDLHNLALTLTGLSISCWQRGDYETAEKYGEESLQVSQQLGHPLVIVNALNNLGELAFHKQQYLVADYQLKEALKIAQKTGAVALAAHSLTGIAALMIEQKNWAKAVELLSLAQHHRTSDGWAKQQSTKLLNQVETQLSPDDFAARVEHGKSAELMGVISELITE